MGGTGDFVWDNAKADANWRRHGVTFGQAIKAFRDPKSVELIDDREDYGEERINLVGMCEGLLLHVTFTMRGVQIKNHLGPTGETT